MTHRDFWPGNAPTANAALTSPALIMKAIPDTYINQPIAAAAEQLLLRRVTELYTRSFAEHSPARAALAQHGLSNLALLEQHQAGYCPGHLRKILNDPELKPNLTQLGIFEADGNERFTGHVLFPMLDGQGAIGDLWAVSPNGHSSLFLPNRPNTFWNLAAAKLSSQLYVTASPLDGLALKTAGFSNTVALSCARGKVDTSFLEKNGIQRLVVVAGDAPSGTATYQALAANLKPYPLEVIELPKCSGALAFLKANGAKALAEAIVAGSNGVTTVNVPNMRPRPDGFILPLRDILYTAIGLERTKRSLRATIRAERGEKKTAVTLDFNQLRSRREFNGEMARVFQEPVDRIESDLGKLQDACDLRLTQTDLPMSDSVTDAIAEGDRREAELMGKDPDLFRIVTEDHRVFGIAGEDDNIRLCFLATVSRKMTDPLAVMFISSFGVGKNTIADKARDLCPPEDQFDATYISGKALFHVAAHALKNKLVTIGEQEGAKHANYPLRSLMSAKSLTAIITARDPVSGRLQAETKRIEGPVAVIITSSDPNLDRETLSRFIVTASDESREQTLAIREEQRRAQTQEGLAARQATARVFRRHHAYHRLLQPYGVVIPDKIRVDYGDDRLCSRRDYPKVQGLIKAVAFARQMQKTVIQVEGVHCIVVDETDLTIARPLIRKLFVASFDELSTPSRDLLWLLDRMKASAREQPDLGHFDDAGRFSFTRRQVREQGKCSNTSLHRCLTELIDYEYVLRDITTRRRPYRYVLDWVPPVDGTDVPVKFHSVATEAMPGA
jgi:hypothetical protein